MSNRLQIELLGLNLRNPIIAASGTFGYGVEFLPVTNVEALGAFIVKGISPEPIRGNPRPRIWEAEGGMINSIGLQNIGVASFIRDKVPHLRQVNTPWFVNVFGYAVEDYLAVVKALEDVEGPAAYELNVSCPNTKHGGMFFSADPCLLGDLVVAVRKISKRPLIVKLSPNVASIGQIAKAAEDAGADAVSLVNTFVSLAIDVRTRRPRIGAGFGGLSGPAIKPIALRMVYEAAQAVRIPVIGLGGIASGEDAAEFMIAGASAVEVGTASFWDPAATARIARELGQFAEEQKLNSVRDLVGTLRMK